MNSSLSRKKVTLSPPGWSEAVATFVFHDDFIGLAETSGATYGKVSLIEGLSPELLESILDAAVDYAEEHHMDPAYWVVKVKKAEAFDDGPLREAGLALFSEQVTFAYDVSKSRRPIPPHVAERFRPVDRTAPGPLMDFARLYARCLPSMEDLWYAGLGHRLNLLLESWQPEDLVENLERLIDAEIIGDDAGEYVYVLDGQSVACLVAPAGKGWVNITATAPEQRGLTADGLIALYLEQFAIELAAAAASPIVRTMVPEGNRSSVAVSRRMRGREVIRTAFYMTEEALESLRRFVTTADAAILPVTDVGGAS